MKTNRIYTIIYAIMIVFSAMSCGSSNSAGLDTGDRFGADTTRLDLIFSLTWDETSKDSNTHSYEITIKDGKMEYKQTYSGFIEQPDEVLSKKISVNSEKEILDYLEKMKLNVNLTEKRNTRGIGIARYMTLEIRQPEASAIHIAGRTSIWGIDEQLTGDNNKTDTLSLSKEAMEYLGKGDGFVSFIKNNIK